MSSITKEDIIRLMDIVPRGTSIKLKVPYLFWRREKEFKIRPFSFRDKVEILNEYTEIRFNEIATNPGDIQFEILNFKIVYMLIEDKKPFKSFEDFTKAIIGFKKETEILAAALFARGVASSALLTMAEMKELTEDLKKKPGADQPLTGDMQSTN